MEEADVALSLKWQGKATAALPRSTADDVWPLVEDFFNFHKWLPNIDTCFKVSDAADADAGDLVRYCAAAPVGGDAAVRWCRERLTEIDPAGKRLSYEIIDNNMGFKSYAATLRVAAIDGGGCEIEWSFAADPVEGLSCEDLAKYIGLGLRGMAENMERALESALNLSSA